MAPTFSVISGAQVHRALVGREKQVVDLVDRAYRLHGDGDSVNPPSYFLRFPDRPSSRIIALPASLGGEFRADGLKWISSFPENVARGIPRASAVLILNDHDTGYPFACMEASIISAARTAASAALAADWLSRGRDRPTRVGFVGTGLIARYIHTYLRATGWSFTVTGAYDTVPEHADAFRDYLARTDGGGRLISYPSAEALIRGSDLIVFATVAGSPHVTEPGWFAHDALVLHVSLRDLAPAVILAALNVVDDVEHCLRAGTSLHLAQEQVGNRDFVHGTLYDVLTGHLVTTPDRPVVFSPFGLGVLDLAVASYVHSTIADEGELRSIDDFFFELNRYGRG